MPLSLFFLAPMALAAAPEPFDLSRLDDLGDWHDRSRELLNGPPGCIEARGRVRLQISIYSPGGLFSAASRKDIVGQGTFEGRLDEGAWTRLETTWEDQPDSAVIALEIDRFRPIVGRLPPRSETAQPTPIPSVEERYAKDEIVMAPESTADPHDSSFAVTNDGTGYRLHIDGGDDAALGMLDEIIENIDPNGTSVYATWDTTARSVQMTESVPLDNGEALEIKVHFPEGGPPTRLDAHFPSRLRISDEGPTVTIRDGQLHLRSRSTDLGIVPGVEGMSAVIGMMGFTLGIDQRVSYDHVRACPSG